MAEALMTLGEVKERLNIKPGDARYDEELEGAIAAASAAILTYTGRDFASAVVTEERQFEYDGSGYLEIDDATEITAVSIQQGQFGATPVASDFWSPKPFRRSDSPVYTYIELPGGVGMYGSPEMGFKRNMDVLAREGRWPVPQAVAIVDGTWGWPEVPEDIKQAALWTIEEFRAANAKSERLTSESIDGYARAWNRQMISKAIPNRAADLLEGYIRWTV